MQLLDEDIQKRSMTAIAKACFIAWLGEQQSALDAYENIVGSNGSLTGKTTALQVLLVLGDLSRARTESQQLLRVLDGYDSRWWINEPILKYIANPDELEAGGELLSEVGSSRPQLCRAHYFLGLRALGQSDVDRAKEHFAKSMESGQFYRLEYCMSRAFLERIDARINSVQTEAR